VQERRMLGSARAVRNGCLYRDNICGSQLLTNTICNNFIVVALDMKIPPKFFKMRGILFLGGKVTQP